MADISIEEAKAKVWLDDVNNELNEVEVILNKVNTCLTTVIGSDDTIMAGICNIGTAMENAWGNMCKAFKNVQGSVGKVLSQLFTTAQNVVDDADAIRAKIN